MIRTLYARLRRAYLQRQVARYVVKLAIFERMPVGQVFAECERAIVTIEEETGEPFAFWLAEE